MIALGKVKTPLHCFITSYLSISSIEPALQIGIYDMYGALSCSIGRLPFSFIHMGTFVKTTYHLRVFALIETHYL